MAEANPLGSSEIIEKLTNEFLDKVREHVDSVRVFVTMESDDGEANTQAVSIGRGSFYAQIGYIKDWIIKQDQIVRNNVHEPL